MGIDTTIFGSTLKPFVSSSKNRNSPALDAGSGALFFLLLMVIFQSKKINIKTLLLLQNLVLNHSFLRVYFSPKLESE